MFFFFWGGGGGLLGPPAVEFCAISFTSVYTKCRTTIQLHVHVATAFNEVQYLINYTSEKLGGLLSMALYMYTTVSIFCESKKLYVHVCTCTCILMVEIICMIYI